LHFAVIDVLAVCQPVLIIVHSITAVRLMTVKPTLPIHALLARKTILFTQTTTSGLFD
jgi:hypothetical protein